MCVTLASTSQQKQTHKLLYVTTIFVSHAEHKSLGIIIIIIIIIILLFTSFHISGIILVTIVAIIALSTK